jgi:hypothetical protein
MLLNKAPIKLLFVSLFVGVLFLSFSPRGVSASHSWGGYHWARTSNPFTLKLGNNVTANWSPYLATTASDWSVSTVLDMNIVPGGTNARRCKPTLGRVEVCNSSYGNNGWLGLAQVWISGTHITQGVTKLNDTYFNTPTYNTAAWRNLVTCQEVGHTIGLDHQDENFSNPPLGTCMDYTNDPTPNQHPNQHDYDELLIIYSHLDSFSSLQSTIKSPFGFSVGGAELNGEYENKSEWGKEIRKNGRLKLFERDFGNGSKLYSFILGVQE